MKQFRCFDGFCDAFLASLKTDSSHISKPPYSFENLFHVFNLVMHGQAKDGPWNILDRFAKDSYDTDALLHHQIIRHQWIRVIVEPVTLVKSRYHSLRYFSQVSFREFGKEFQLSTLIESFQWIFAVKTHWRRSLQNVCWKCVETNIN